MNPHPEFLVGIALAALGWIVLPWAVRISGFLLGSTVGILVVDLASLVFPDFRPNSLVFLVSAFLLGFLGAVLAGKVFRITFFVAGFVATILLKARLDEFQGFSQSLAGGALGDFPLTIWFSAACGLVGGFLIGLMKQYVIVVLTALAGSVLAARHADLEEKWWLLALVGVAFQVLCLSTLPKKWTRIR